MKYVLIPIFCILLSFFVLLTDDSFMYHQLNDEAKQPTKQLVEHFFWQNEIPTIYNEQETAHLRDVTLLVKIAAMILIVTTVLLFKDKQWMNETKKGTILLLIVLFLATIIPFDKLFTIFHQILFPQGNWTFPIESTLIQYYSQIFFQNYAIAIAINALIALLILNIIAKNNNA